MTFDPLSRTDRLEPGTLEALVTRFEARGKHPQFSNMLVEYVDAMNIDSANTVLDVGCGTGLAARVIVHRRSFQAKVKGHRH